MTSTTLSSEDQPQGEVRYSISESPLGYALVANSKKGLCALWFSDTVDELVQEVMDVFSSASLQQDDSTLKHYTYLLRQFLEGESQGLDVLLDVQATEFQAAVWDAIRRIPYGETWSYAQLAEAIEQPKAVRAVARACSANPVAIVTPCHRVLRSDGSMGGFRWGVERKKVLLELERNSSTTQETLF